MLYAINESTVFFEAFKIKPVRGTHFFIYKCENNLIHNRLGIVVAKRLYKHAVLRNLIKRIIREVFRELLITFVEYPKNIENKCEIQFSDKTHVNSDFIVRLHKKFSLKKVYSRSLLKLHCFMELRSLSHQLIGRGFVN